MGEHSVVPVKSQDWMGRLALQVLGRSCLAQLLHPQKLNLASPKHKLYIGPGLSCELPWYRLVVLGYTWHQGSHEQGIFPRHQALERVLRHAPSESPSWPAKIW